MSERSKTDVITRKKLQPFYDDPDWDVFEEEVDRGRYPDIQERLDHASKRGTGKTGKPEFIGVHKKSFTILLVEDKLELKDHESPDFNDPVRCAVDGVKHYASLFNDKYNTIAVGCSGKDENEYKVSSYVRTTDEKADNLVAKKILNPNDYLSYINQDREKINETRRKLRGFSKKYHNDLRDNAKLLEEQKPIFVGAILTALTDPAFRKTYKEYKGRPVELAHITCTHIEQVVKTWIDDEKKREHILHSVGFIKIHPTFTNPKGDVLLDLIDALEQNIHPDVEKDVAHLDLLTEFYREFIRYSGGDGKGLGIVMTPPHICELFAELANLHEKSRVLDCCMGTGGFLVGGLTKMKPKFGNDHAALVKFQKNNLIGVEQQANMFTLSCINMMLRRCNPDNFYLSDCFNIKQKLKAHNCTVGFLNPPYSQKGENLKELDFVENMLECLTEGSLGFAIVPMSCAVEKSGVRKRLLQKHTLEAVMSMPPELFSPGQEVPSCIMVFKAHIPHNSNIDTWFACWQDDGFIKVKRQGREDYYGKWAEVKPQWVDMFLNRKEIPGISIKHKVTEDDEWCIEAFREVDYSNLQESDFTEHIKKYIFFNVIGKLGSKDRPHKWFFDIDSQFYDDLKKSCVAEKVDLYSRKWVKFLLSDERLFDVRKGKRVTKKDLTPGETPYITSTGVNNGVTDYVEIVPNHKGNTITVNYDGNVGNAYYQENDYYALDSVNILYPKFELDRHIAMFIITIIETAKINYNYARKWHLGRMKQTEIMLPVTDEGLPDWEFMRNYIKSLPYSKHV